jgi:hypothetical protein
MCQTETGLTANVSFGMILGYILGEKIIEEQREQMRNNLPDV